jgi:hypothetical protein
MNNSSHVSGQLMVAIIRLRYPHMTRFRSLVKNVTSKKRAVNFNTLRLPQVHMIGNH